MHALSYLNTEYDGKSIAVFGLGVSGLSTVRALIAAHVPVIAWDDNPHAQEKAKEAGATIQNLTEVDFSSIGLLILAPGIPFTFQPHEIVQKAQAQNVEIICDIELFARCHDDIQTIGITGTNGKSTTTALMTHALNECGFKAVMGGNIGVPVFDMDLTDTPDFIVFELSSYQLDLCTQFTPDISILLNITPDHLDRHGSMKAYVEAKKRIFRGKGDAIIAVDDDFTNNIFDALYCGDNDRMVYPVSTQVEIPEAYYVRHGILFQNTRGQSYQLMDLSDLPTLKGRHNHQNFLCVYRVLKTLGCDDQAIFDACHSYPGLKHRQYCVTTYHHVTYINDSKATNAEAAAKALSAYENIYWIVGGRAKDGGLEGLEIFKGNITKAFVIGECAAEFSHWLSHHGFAHMMCETMDNAVAAAHKTAHKTANADNKPATILLSPATASWDQFASFEKRGEAFEDIVHALTQVREA